MAITMTEESRSDLKLEKLYSASQVEAGKYFEYDFFELDIG
jgi:hypothetical protein